MTGPILALVVLLQAAPPYTPPAPLAPAAAKKRFPAGNPSKAKKANAEGLKLSKAGDGPGAIAAYRRALDASAASEVARFNLACELARSGDADGAIAALEVLLMLDTVEAQKYAAKAALDDDFASLRADPRFTAIGATFAFDPAKPVLAQLCHNVGRVARIVDPAGIPVYIEEEATPDGRKARHLAGTATGTQVRGLVYDLLSLRHEYCDGRRVLTRLASGGRAKDTTLQGRSGLVCIDRVGGMEWTTTDALCFASVGGRWSLAFASTVPEGPLDDSYKAKVKRESAAARRAAEASLLR